MGWDHPRLMPVLDQWQRGLPLVARPFAEIATLHHYTEAELLADLAGAQQTGVISRVGGVFAPNTLGASTLAAVSVPESQIEAAATFINRYAEVNHNYLRDHAFNLWFVVTAPDAERRAQVLAEIAEALQTGVLDLPLEAEYHIDLGFSLADGQRHRRVLAQRVRPVLSVPERRLAEALGQGLPLVARPYALVGAASGLSEAEVLGCVQHWQESGVLRRLGLILRHHELGYTANAMGVWQVDLARRDQIGAAMAAQDGVNLCYGRPARPGWPYTLFAMLHGKDRAVVEVRMAALTEALGLGGTPHACLVSLRRFRQRGAVYRARAA